jgi:hypothetical protein
MTIRQPRLNSLVLVIAVFLALPAMGDAVPDPPVDSVPDLQDSESPLIVKQRNFVIVPIPLSNPTIGTGLILGGAYFYKQTPEQKKVQPASVTGVGGMYTTTDSYAYGIGQQSYWNEDKWRFAGFLGYVNLELPLFAPSPNDPNGVGLDWLVEGTFMQAKIQRAIARNWYIGAWGRYFDTQQKFSINISGDNFELGTDLKAAGLGLNAEFDTRDVPANAYKGRRFEINALFNSEALGSTDDYQGYDARYRSYHHLMEELVLAWEVRGCWKSGEVPLWDACKVNLRGFPLTEYLAKTSASTQIEGRWKPFKSIGFAAFLGAGMTDRTYTDFRDDNLIPSYGVGFRWMVMKAQRINLRIDYGRSDGQDAWYLAASEAF